MLILLLYFRKMDSISGPETSDIDKPSTDEDASSFTHPQTDDYPDKPSAVGDASASSTVPAGVAPSTLATGPSYDSQGDKPSPKDVLLGSKVHKIKAVNVTVQYDRDMCNIVGSCFMPGGELVLCDFNNYKIKVLDRSLSVVDSLWIPGAPRDIAVIDKNNVIATMPRRKRLHFYQVLPTLQRGRTVDVNLPCHSVDVAASKIFVSSYKIGDTSGEIRIYDLQGRVLEKIHGVNQDGLRTFRLSSYIAASRSGDKIFVSDSTAGTVACCLTSNGKIVFQYKDTDLKTPSGLSVDDDDNVFVSGSSSNTVQLITTAGKKHKTLLSSKGGISGPTTVSFRPSDGTLVVSCRDNDKIFIYKVS